MKLNYEDVNRKIILLGDIADIEPYEIILPEPPKPELIGNYGLKKEDQFFQREKVPRKVWEITHAINNGKMTREEAKVLVLRDSELLSFVQDQWRKREFGDWQYIYGKPYYLTGTYWFFLNYYLMDIGHPNFRETQWEQSLWWKFCVEENQAVYGGINFTRRREGKTFFCGNLLLEYATRNEKTMCGIQSKSEEDADAFYLKAIRYQFRRLPFFFQPDHETAGKMKKSVNMVGDDITNSLETLIDFKSTTPTAYDGQKLGRWAGDEFGKMVNPADPIEIWDKNKYCFYNDGEIIGKALITSTVEEMTKGGGDKFNYLWCKSSRIPKEGMINEYGETQTGLVPYFTPAPKNIFHDQYGMPIIDSPKPYQAEWRKAKKDKFWNVGGKEYIDKQIESAKNAKDKQDVIRKFPRNIREAFRYNNTGCLFDIDVINSRLDFFYGREYPKEYPMTFGYFEWVKDKEFKEARFIPTSQEQARVHIRYMPPIEQQNRFMMRGTKQCPVNTMRFNMGCDPFKLKTEQVIDKSRMSLGAAHVFAFLDPAVDQIGKPRDQWLTDNFVLEYLYRPDTPDLFCEDMAMIAVFYGCKCFPESNIQIVDTYFRDNGLEEYLQFRYKAVQSGSWVGQKEDKKMAGAYNIEAFKPVLIRWGINFVREKGMYCPFYRTLEQLRDVSYETFNEYDSAVSAMYTLVASFDQPKSKEKKDTFDYKRDIGMPALRSYR